MNAELAQMVLMTALRTRIELGDLPSIIESQGNEDEDEAIKLMIASAIYEISRIMDAVFRQYPELEAQTEDRRTKYGRPYY